MNVMVSRLLRLIVLVVTSWALIGYGPLIGYGLTPGHSAAYAAMTSTKLIAQHDHPCGPMMLNGHETSHGQPSMPGCLTDIGCLLTVGIPASPVRVAKPFAWTRVDYWARTATGRGITSEPAIGPPISRV